MAPQQQQFSFNFQDVAEALVKAAKVHEGFWGISVEFGLAATNIAQPDDTLIPAAIIPIAKIGITRFSEPNSLTVDAALVNPAIEAGRG